MSNATARERISAPLDASSTISPLDKNKREENRPNSEVRLSEEGDQRPLRLFQRRKVSELFQASLGKGTFTRLLEN
jgi:hypothetical protein